MEAEKDATDMGKLKASITKGEGNLVGFLGEIVTGAVIDAQRVNTFHYDLVKDSKLIDVKTKRCTSEPQLWYDCSVAAFNTKQECTHYVFTRVLDPEHTICWVLGYLTKDDYFKLARFCKKGEIDTHDRTGRQWPFKADCYNVEISKLKDIRELR